MQDFLRIHEDDNVVVAINTLAPGTVVDLGDVQVEAGEEIPAGHKMAIKDIACGEPVTKYGVRIGNAKEDIKAGQWIHTHNVKTASGASAFFNQVPVIYYQHCQLDWCIILIRKY